MKLDEFIKAIKQCPDEIVKLEYGCTSSRLSARYGIGDNLPIFVRASAKRVNDILLKSGMFKYLRFEGGYRTDWNYSGGLIVAAVKHEPPVDTSSCNLPENDVQRRHSLWQETCPSWIQLHPYQKDNIPAHLKDKMVSRVLNGEETRYVPDFLKDREIATLIEKLTPLFIKHKIGFCLPHSPGYDAKLGFFSPLSKVVYWPDSLEEEMNK